MIRLATTYLVIAVVLSCPYQCLGEAIHEAGAPGHQGVCCCKAQDHSTGDETPQSPDERDGDCLCHGAIFDGSRTAENELVSPVAMEWVLKVTWPTIDPSPAAVSFGSRHPFPPFSTGRDVCALTCRLQL